MSQRIDYTGKTPWNMLKPCLKFQEHLHFFMMAFSLMGHSNVRPFLAQAPR